MTFDANKMKEPREYHRIMCLFPYCDKPELAHVLEQDGDFFRLWRPMLDRHFRIWRSKNDMKEGHPGEPRYGRFEGIAGKDFQITVERITTSFVPPKAVGYMLIPRKEKE